MKLCRVVTIDETFATLLRRQVKVVAESGIDLTLVSSPGEQLDQIARESGARSHAIRMTRAITPRDDMKSLLDLARFLRAESFDIVHSSTQKAGLLSAVAGRLAGIPLRFHTFTGQRWIELRGFSRFATRFSDRVIARLCTHCYADSFSQMEFLIAQGIVPRRRISVLASGSISGVDLRRFDPANRTVGVRRELGISDEALVILFVGRLNRDKGIVELLTAFSGLEIPDRNVELVLVGPMEDEGGLPEHAAQPRIHRVGFTLAPERYMAIADVLCLPSYREGFGSVIVEAAAMGVPAVATRIVGLVDAVVDGETGILVEPKDSESLRRALGAILRDDGMRRRMGIAARERAVRFFDDEIVNRAVMNEYRSVHSRRARVERKGVPVN